MISSWSCMLFILLKPLLAIRYRIYVKIVSSNIVLVGKSIRDSRMYFKVLHFKTENVTIFACQNILENHLSLQAYLRENIYVVASCATIKFPYFQGHMTQYKFLFPLAGLRKKGDRIQTATYIRVLDEFVKHTVLTIKIMSEIH